VRDLLLPVNDKSEKQESKKRRLIKLRAQLDAAIESGAPEAYSALLKSMADELVKARGDETASAIGAVEQVWYKGLPPPSPLPVCPEHSPKLAEILSDMLAVQSFALSISKGDLSQTLRAKGVMAGSFKAVQGSLRHLTWQTRMIARGDFTQRVDFMGEFSEAFNEMVGSLSAAREEIKRNTEELVHANANLVAQIAEREQAEDRLRESRARLEESNKALESFAYTVSHDLRAPLRAISGYARMLAEDHGPSLKEEGNRWLDGIVANAVKMGQLMDDLLSLSRLGHRAMNVSRIDMNSLVEDVLAMLRTSTTGSRPEMLIAPLPAAEGDPVLIRQVLVNLLENAFKFSRKKPDPRIEVGSFERDGEKVYFVKDNGAGFDMKYSEKLFGVFQRLVSEKEYEGTGIGLATVHRIITRHGGRIWAEAAPDEGATFFFTLEQKKEATA